MVSVRRSMVVLPTVGLQSISLYSTNGCIPDLQRLVDIDKVRQSGDGSPQHSLRAECLLACCRTRPQNPQF